MFCLVSELLLMNLGVIYPLCFLSSCVFSPLFVLSLLFNFILLFHLPLSISLSLSFFSEFYLVSISFCLLFIYILWKNRAKKWGKKEIKKNMGSFTFVYNLKKKTVWVLVLFSYCSINLPLVLFSLEKNKHFS